MRITWGSGHQRSLSLSSALFLSLTLPHSLCLHVILLPSPQPLVPPVFSVNRTWATPGIAFSGVVPLMQQWNSRAWHGLCICGLSFSHLVKLAGSDSSSSKTFLQPSGECWWCLSMEEKIQESWKKHMRWVLNRHILNQSLWFCSIARLHNPKHPLFI